MKVAIVGAGAMGSLFGGLLAEAGHEVWLCDIRQDPMAHVFQVAVATAPNRSSMGQDVDHHRPTEIGSINGFVVSEARRLGISTPVNQVLTALVETMEAHYLK